MNEIDCQAERLAVTIWGNWPLFCGWNHYDASYRPCQSASQREHEH